MAFENKSPSMRAYLNSTARKIYGRTISYALKHGICVSCSKNQHEQKGFDNLKSVREYKISGLCQECQDEVFTPSEGEEE